MARSTDWIDTITSTTIASGAQGNVSLMGGNTPDVTRGWTSARVVLDLSIHPATAVSDGFQQLTLGIGVMSQEAFTAVVFPDANIGADRPARGWLYRNNVSVAGAAAMVSHAPIRITADIRGKRKVDNGELVMVLNNTTIDGTAFMVRVNGLVRVLFLLA